MTELDFEELDKAVNNLMKDVEVSRSAHPQSTGSPVEPSASPIVPNSNNKKPGTTQKTQPRAFHATSSTASKVGETKVAPLATKRRGRFMDVMYPAPQQVVEKQTSVKRQGIAVQPLSANLEANSPNESSAEQPRAKPEPLGSSERPGQLEPEATYPGALNFEMEREETNVLIKTGAVPDADAKARQKSNEPAAMAGTQPAPEAARPADNFRLKQSEPVSSSAIDFSANDDPNDSPLTSPFLTDAKVEKRPLGGAVAQEPDVPAEPVAPEPEPEDAGAQASTEPQGTSKLPEELSHEVMQVESGSSKQADDIPKIETAEIRDSVHEEISNDNLEKEPEPTPDPVAQINTTEGSILPQYKEKPPAIDENASGAIFDTASYHQPLEHPAKHKSGIGIILWVIGLAVLGALIGAAAYYFVMR